MSDPPFAVRARYVFPVSSPPIAGGVLTIRNGRIAAVGENLSSLPPRDLGNVALLPGLVNAHTHLQFSDLKSPLGTPGMRFAAWIREVIRHLRAAHDLPNAEAARRAAMASGIAESRASGVAALGDIATPGWSASEYAPPPEATVFLELLSLRWERLELLVQAGQAHLQLDFKEGTQPGLSPHAPYTVPFALVGRTCALSAKSGAPLAMHLAESTEELELLSSHSGALVELLSEADAWEAGAIPRGIRPLDYLRELANAARALVIHGNYLSDAELGFLGEHRERMSLVYCPRTHAYFGHARYPLAKALSLGANVALGTDSRASNPDLSLWSEMRHVAHAFPEINPADVLRMGTLNGAAALGIDASFGSLEVGRRAAFALVPLADRPAADPHGLLFEAAECKLALSASPGELKYAVEDRE